MSCSNLRQSTSLRVSTGIRISPPKNRIICLARTPPLARTDYRSTQPCISV